MTTLKYVTAAALLVAMGSGEASAAIDSQAGQAVSAWAISTKAPVTDEDCPSHGPVRCDFAPLWVSATDGRASGRDRFETETIFDPTPLEMIVPGPYEDPIPTPLPFPFWNLAIDVGGCEVPVRSSRLDEWVVAINWHINVQGDVTGNVTGWTVGLSGTF